MADLKKWFSGDGGAKMKLPAKPQPLKQKIRIPGDGEPFQIVLGKQRLHCFPDTPLSAPKGGKNNDWIVLDPDRF